MASILQTLSRFFASPADLTKYASEIESGYWMEHLKPFISTLPNGNKFWTYVLTGEGEQALKQANAFLDLDRVVIALHAKDNAPQLYKYIGESTYASAASQSEVMKNLRKILYEVTETLIEDLSMPKKKLTAFRHAYLRLLEIFFYIDDQNGLDEEFYDQLVTEGDYTFLSDSEYVTRFSAQGIADDGKLSEKQEEKIREFIEELGDSGPELHHKMLQDMDRIFDATRLAFDQKFFEDDDVGSFMFACYLRLHDKTHKKNDQYSVFIQEFITRNELSVIESVLRAEIDENQAQCVEDILAFVDQSTGCMSIGELSAKLANELEQETNVTLHISSYGGKQIAYELFNDISSFHSLVVGCFWLTQANASDRAARLMQLSITLAPHRTLHKLSQQFRIDFGKGLFNDKSRYKSFLKTMKKLGVSEPHAQAFEVVYFQESSPKDYLWKVGKYAISVITGRSKDVDTGLRYASEKDRQKFYLDCWRLDSKSNFISADFPRVLSEYVSQSECMGDICIANAMARQGINVLIRDFDNVPRINNKIIEKSPNMIEIDLDHDKVLVLLDDGDKYSLLVDSTGGHKDLPEHSSWDWTVDVIVIKQKIEESIVVDIARKLPKYDERKLRLLAAAKQYVDGQLSYQEFYQNEGCYMDTDEFTWTGSYDNKRNHLLPLMLCESDIKKRNRVINFFWPREGLEGNDEFESLASELYLECLLKDGDIGHIDRDALEIDDLNEQYIEKFEIFKDQLIEDVMQLRKEA